MLADWKRHGAGIFSVYGAMLKTVAVLWSFSSSRTIENDEAAASVRLPHLLNIGYLLINKENSFSSHHWIDCAAIRPETVPNIKASPLRYPPSR